MIVSFTEKEFDCVLEAFSRGSSFLRVSCEGPFRGTVSSVVAVTPHPTGSGWPSGTPRNICPARARGRGSPSFPAATKLLVFDERPTAGWGGSAQFKVEKVTLTDLARGAGSPRTIIDTLFSFRGGLMEEAKGSLVSTRTGLPLSAGQSVLCLAFTSVFRFKANGQ